MDQPHQRPDWNPATSQPGETYLMNDDPRVRAYRRSAMVTALGWLAAGGIVLFVVVMLFVLL
jgi:hypothetical protein